MPDSTPPPCKPIASFFRARRQFQLCGFGQHNIQGPLFLKLRLCHFFLHFQTPPDLAPDVSNTKQTAPATWSKFAVCLLHPLSSSLLLKSQLDLPEKVSAHTLLLGYSAGISPRVSCVRRIKSRGSSLDQCLQPLMSPVAEYAVRGWGLAGGGSRAAQLGKVYSCPQLFPSLSASWLPWMTSFPQHTLLPRVSTLEPAEFGLTLLKL